MQKFKSGDICKKTATYAQFRIKTGECIGIPYYRYIREGLTFPQAERGGISARLTAFLKKPKTHNPLRR